MLFCEKINFDFIKGFSKDSIVPKEEDEGITWLDKKKDKFFLVTFRPEAIRVEVNMLTSFELFYLKKLIDDEIAKVG